MKNKGGITKASITNGSGNTIANYYTINYYQSAPVQGHKTNKQMKNAVDRSTELDLSKKRAQIIQDFTEIEGVDFWDNLEDYLVELHTKYYMHETGMVLETRMDDYIYFHKLRELIKNVKKLEYERKSGFKIAS